MVCPTFFNLSLNLARRCSWSELWGKPTLHQGGLECKSRKSRYTWSNSKFGLGVKSPWVSNPKRWCCGSAALNMPANLENSPVATGLEKVSFHSNHKERQCHRMLKLPHNYKEMALTLPLQYSCLENSMDWGAYWAIVHGVAESRTWLSNFTFTFTH